MDTVLSFIFKEVFSVGCLWEECRLEKRKLGFQARMGWQASIKHIRSIPRQRSFSSIFTTLWRCFSNIQVQVSRSIFSSLHTNSRLIPIICPIIIYFFILTQLLNLFSKWLNCPCSQLYWPGWILKSKVWYKSYLWRNIFH